MCYTDTTRLRQQLKHSFCLFRCRMEFSHWQFLFSSNNISASSCSSHTATSSFRVWCWDNIWVDFEREMHCLLFMKTLHVGKFPWCNKSGDIWANSLANFAPTLHHNFHDDSLRVVGAEVHGKVVKYSQSRCWLLLKAFDNSHDFEMIFL